VRVLHALICEDAPERQDGRFDALGIFQQLYAPGFPAQQERLVVVVGIEWDAGEMGRHEFRIDLTDPNGSPVLTINGHTEVGERAPGDAPQRTLLIMPLEGVVFPTPGTYSFDLSVEGGEVMRLCPLHLIENRDAG
jgi:hypothetical protein